MEFDTIEEGREDEILLRALRTAELEVFRRRLSGFDFSGAPRAGSTTGFAVDTCELTPASRPARDRSATCPVWRSCSTGWGSRRRAPGVAASAVEFALEGLHLSRRLNKDGGDGAARYTGADAS